MKFNVFTRTAISIAFAAAFLPLDSHATVLQTTDATAVAAFQVGATVETFDDLPGLTITSYVSQPVPVANQFSSRNTAAFTSPVYNSGGASFNDPIGNPATSNPGTPIGIYTPSGAIAGEVKSGTNVAGPLATGTTNSFGGGFMEVIFPSDISKVGFWITHTSGPLNLFLKDSTNNNLLTGDFQILNATQGQFIGISRGSADIRGITIGFPDAFTIDDFTFGDGVTTTVPDNSFTAGLLGISLAGLAYFARRQRVSVR